VHKLKSGEIIEVFYADRQMDEGSVLTGASYGCGKPKEKHKDICSLGKGLYSISHI
jgi:hypothetical protein